jgi:hypothetical protein
MVGITKKEGFMREYFQKFVLPKGWYSGDILT